MNTTRGSVEDKPFKTQKFTTYMRYNSEKLYIWLRWLVYILLILVFTL